MDKYLKTSRQSMPDISRKTGECLSFNRQIFKKAPNPSKIDSRAPPPAPGQAAPARQPWLGPPALRTGNPAFLPHLVTCPTHAPTAPPRPPSLPPPAVAQGGSARPGPAEQARQGPGDDQLQGCMVS